MRPAPDWPEAVERQYRAFETVLYRLRRAYMDAGSLQRPAEDLLSAGEVSGQLVCIQQHAVRSIAARILCPCPGSWGFASSFCKQQHATYLCSDTLLAFQQHPLVIYR